jgi:hypothetical protein
MLHAVSTGEVIIDVSNDHTAFFFRVKKNDLNCLTLGYGTDRLSRNVGKKLPFYAAPNNQIAQISRNSDSCISVPDGIYIGADGL